MLAPGRLVGDLRTMLLLRSALREGVPHAAGVRGPRDAHRLHLVGHPRARAALLLLADHGAARRVAQHVEALVPLVGSPLLLQAVPWKVGDLRQVDLRLALLRHCNDPTAAGAQGGGMPRAAAPLR